MKSSKNLFYTFQPNYKMGNFQSGVMDENENINIVWNKRKFSAPIKDMERIGVDTTDYNTNINFYYSDGSILYFGFRVDPCESSQVSGMHDLLSKFSVICKNRNIKLKST